MNISEVEKQRLANLCNIRDSNSNIELECLFNHSGSIHFTEFSRLLKYIKSKAFTKSDRKYIKNTWNFIKSEDTLDITVHKNDIIHRRSDFNIRTTITSKEDISKYCQTNSLDGIRTKNLYKKSHQVQDGFHDYKRRDILLTSLLPGDKVIVKTATEGYINGTVKHIEYITKLKKKYFIEDRRGKQFVTEDHNDIELIQYGMYLSDHDIKINIKSEVDIENLDVKDDKDYYEQEASAHYDTYGEFLRSNGGLKKVYKTYRLKNRYSYRYNSLRLDLTVVRSSASELNNKGYMVQKPTLNLIDSNLISEDKQYEVELEIDYDYNRRHGIYNTSDVSLHILKILYEIKLHINHYPSIISKQESKIVLDTYKALIRSNHKQILEKKLTIIKYMLQEKKIESLSEEERVTYLESTPLVTITDIPATYVSEYQALIKSNKSNIIKLKKKYESMLDNIQHTRGSYSNNKTYFIGPKLVSMNIKDIQEKSSDTILKENYSVTDKADGLGMLMYIYGTDHLSDVDIQTITSSKHVSDGKDILDPYRGHIYLIDQNVNVYKTHLSLQEDQIDTYVNTLFNGEYLDSDSRRNKINVFKIYDAYIFNNKDIKHLPLQHKKTGKESRINYIRTFLESDDDIDINKLVYKQKPITDYTNNILQISKKKFLYSYPKVSKKTNKITTTLFKHSRQLWDKYTSNLSIYKYDGLIYTPCDTPVGYSNNSCDYDLFTHTTWSKNIKWKPPYENTIDFLVKEVKEETNINGNIIYSPLIQTKRNTQDGTAVYKKYKTFHLYVGKNVNNSGNSCSNNMRQRNRYLPVQFVPSILYDDMAYVANIEINPSDNEAYSKHWDHTTNEWKQSSFDIIKDNTIVEFAYSNFDEEDGHYKTDKTFRWIPIRTRHDKTFSYKKGTVEKKKLYNMLKYILHLRKNSFNDSTNRDFKSSIKHYLKAIKHIINDVPFIKINYKTRNYNDLLNQIIHHKDNIITYYSSYEYISKYININYGNNFNTANSNWFSIHNPITEDMITTGKHIPTMDIYELKYYNQSINIKRSKSISIQLQRFHNLIKTNMISNITSIIRGDQSDKKINLLDLASGKGGDLYKWINNGIHNVVGIDKVYDNIYNSFDGACIRRTHYSEKNNNKMPIIDFVVADVSKSLQDTSNFIDMFSKDRWFTRYISTTFDIVTMMFALHYMFNDEDSISMLVQNINSTIKKGGYFIGCCFDGKAVFDLLKDVQLNESKIGYKKGEVIWKIQKKYSLTSWTQSDETDDSIFYDLPIDVYIRSINMTITEYLVNFNVFIKKLEEVNIKLIDSTPFETIYNDLPSNKKHLSEDEKTLSFLNRQFIFQKVSDKDIVVNRMVDVALQLVNNEMGKNTFKFKKNKKNLIKELKSSTKTEQFWNELIQLITIYIDETNLKEELPILGKDFDTIMNNVFTVLRTKIKLIKL